MGHESGSGSFNICLNFMVISIFVDLTRKSILLQFVCFILDSLTLIKKSILNQFSKRDWKGLKTEAQSNIFAS